jgi:hypothetical protein
MHVTTTDDRDRSLELRAAIDHSGYYPEVVAESVTATVAGENAVAYYVHHEPTFERDEVRRHLTVAVLTPSRLVLVHTDENAGDDLLPEPYLSSSTHAVALAAIRSVVVTRMIANASSGHSRLAEAVLTVSWGAVSRLDLEPASCSDPECEADHGYTGLATGDDFSLRVSAAAEGGEAVRRLLAFAEALSARTYRG